jgi:hypothetical protein
MDMGAVLIAVFTDTMHPVRLLSKYRPQVCMRGGGGPAAYGAAPGAAGLECYWPGR